MPLLWLAGCAPLEAPDAPADSAATVVDVGEPDWSREVVAAFLEDRLARLRPDSEPIVLAYDTLMGHREFGCPLAEVATLAHWVTWANDSSGVCTTDAGWTWFGLADGHAYCELDDTGTSLVDIGALVSFDVYGPAGEHDFAGGTFGQSCVWTAEAGECEGWLTGSFLFSMESDWLAEGIEASVFILDTWEGDAHTILLDGGAGYGEGDIAFQSLTLSDAGSEGGLSVRDPTGYWHELDVDADGCGNLTWRGLDEGTLCLDFSTWSLPLGRAEYVCSSP